ncbi:MAG: hypothetical protein M3M88_02325 [Thermoproteota archaeon]|nr:hypothetical protein [Thermoproteota archaeon]
MIEKNTVKIVDLLMGDKCDTTKFMSYNNLNPFQYPVFKIAVTIAIPLSNANIFENIMVNNRMTQLTISNI